MRVIAIKVREALREMTSHLMLFSLKYRPNKSYLIHIPLGHLIVPIFVYPPMFSYKDLIGSRSNINPNGRPNNEDLIID